MPPMQNAGLSAQMSDVNAVVQQQAARANPPVTYLTTDKSLGTAQGGYTAFVTNAAGQIVNVRAPDGTHLTTGGGQVAAQQVIDELQTLGYHILRADGHPSARRYVGGAPSSWTSADRAFDASAPVPARPGRT